MEYNFESTDKKVNNVIHISISIKYHFDLKNSYQINLTRRDLKFTYKTLKEDKYFITGNLNNGKILYKFCKKKDGYEQNYSIEYNKAYIDFFNKYISEIIKDFRI